MQRVSSEAGVDSMVWGVSVYWCEGSGGGVSEAVRCKAANVLRDSDLGALDVFEVCCMC